MLRRKKLAMVASLVSLWGCVGKGPSTPSPTAPTGNYTLVVEASPVCRLAVSRFQWDLEGTATGSGPGAAVRATLPGGNATVDVSITYLANARVNGSITTRAALQEGEVRVTITGGARGALTTGPGGRGQVLNGVLNGTIIVNRPGGNPSEGTRPGNVVESCTAADHKWMLVPR